MTAAQIVEIVGTERKAWWPERMYFVRTEGGWFCLPEWEPECSIDDEHVELAFIGAAVRGILRLNQVLNLREMPNLLAALVAALNESEAK